MIMNVLLITPHKSEMSFYFLQQQVEMIKSLKEELSIRNKSVTANILSLHQTDFENMSFQEIKQLFDKNRTLIENADIVHSFSEIPLFFRPFFPEMLLVTLNMEKKYESLGHLFPQDGEPGMMVTSTLKQHEHIPCQELLPGFFIDIPRDEFSYNSKNIILFASTRSFVNKTKKAVQEFIPDANFYIKLRGAGSLEEGEEQFNLSLTEDFSFLFGITETDIEKELDLIPLKVMSKGVPMFIVNSPLEKKFYPSFLHLSSLDELHNKYNDMKESIPSEPVMKDELHSFSCRFFFFSKMTDDTLRLYQDILHNRKRKDKRPWGHWETLRLKDTYKVKHFHVTAGEKLSLQSHKYRDEVWSIVGGEGNITVGDETFEAKKGDMFLVNRDQKHRAEATKTDLDVIEIQTGDYLGEDDIVRYEDKYGRK